MVTRGLDENYWSNFEKDLQVFLESGIRCLSGSFNLIFIVIKTIIIATLKIQQVSQSLGPNKSKAHSLLIV